SAGTGNNEFYNPYSILQDSSTKTLYIGNYNNHRMMSYTSDASLGSVVARGNGLGTNNTQLNNPVGLYFDSFTNRASNWILIAGSITGSFGNSSVLLYHPAGVNTRSNSYDRFFNSSSLLDSTWLKGKIINNEYRQAIKHINRRIGQSLTGTLNNLPINQISITQFTILAIEELHAKYAGRIHFVYK
ncbi:unnamed protein product, partial [Rotaria sp. Silwood2]